MIAVATPAMLPVPIDAASAVMNAWNGDSTPARAREPAADHRAERLGKPPNLHDAKTQREEQAAAEEHGDDVRHEERVGDGLDQSSNCRSQKSEID